MLKSHVSFILEKYDATDYEVSLLITSAFILYPEFNWFRFIQNDFKRVYAIGGFQ